MIDKIKTILKWLNKAKVYIILLVLMTPPFLYIIHKIKNSKLKRDIKKELKNIDNLNNDKARIKQSIKSIDNERKKIKAAPDIKDKRKLIKNIKRLLSTMLLLIMVSRPVMAAAYTNISNNNIGTNISMQEYNKIYKILQDYKLMQTQLSNYKQLNRINELIIDKQYRIIGYYNKMNALPLNYKYLYFGNLFVLVTILGVILCK